LKVSIQQLVDERSLVASPRVRSVSFDGGDVSMPVVKVQAIVPPGTRSFVEALSSVAVCVMDCVFASTESIQASVYVSVTRTNALGFSAPKDVLLVKMRRDRWMGAEVRPRDLNGATGLQHANYVFLSSEIHK
jgi:hypothetical protein